MSFVPRVIESPSGMILTGAASVFPSDATIMKTPHPAARNRAPEPTAKWLNQLGDMTAGNVSWTLAGG
jgi:hypothetical protein